MDKKKLAMSEVTTRDWSFEQDVANYTAAGFEGIGVWRDKLDAYGVEPGVELLRDSPLHVSNLIDTGYLLGKTRSQTKRAIEDVREAIELARRLQADSLLLVTGDINSFFRSRSEAEQIVVDALKEVMPMAEAAGVRLAIEPISQRYPGYTFVHTIPDALNIIEAVGSPNLGVLFDTDHLYESPNLSQDIEQAGDRIFAVHLNDLPANPNPGIDRRLLGDGVIPLKEIVVALDDTGYTGFYEVEIMSDVVWGMDYFKVLEETQRRFAELWE